MMWLYWIGGIFVFYYVAACVLLWLGQGEYRDFWECPTCGNKAFPFCNRIWFYQNDHPSCPRCGENTDRYRSKTARWIFTGRWYLPWTWHHAKMEYK